MNDRADLLETTRLQLDLSISDLWWRYFALGGVNTQFELKAILYSALVPTSREYDRIAVALNERACELGNDTYPIPYTTDTQSP